MKVEEQVQGLLTPPTEEAVNLYYSKISKDLGVEVRFNAGNGLGKGVFATRALKANSLVFQEPPMLAVQHVETSGYALVCARCFRMVGSIEEQLTSSWDHLEGEPAAVRWSKSSVNGSQKKLPCSEKFTLPSMVPCPGVSCCDTVYCSTECRDAAWAQHHSLLCPCSRQMTAMVPEYSEFYDHSDCTEDVFKIGSQTVASVLLGALRYLDHKGAPLLSASADIRWEALQHAWTPFSMGQKALWWDIISIPSNMPMDQHDQYRQEMKEMAVESLDLLISALKTRVPMLVAAFPAIFDLQVWGSLLGMFELNNLTLVSPSPIPLWAQEVDKQKLQYKPEHKAIIDSYEAIAAYGGIEGLAEGDDEWVCLGTAFYALQSCINHSCAPNAHTWKRPQDRNGNAVIIARTDIQPGEEILISYVSEEGTLEERRDALKEHGFICECSRCATEQLASKMESSSM